MTNHDISALTEYANEHGLPEIPDTIDTDGCNCHACMDEAYATIRAEARAAATPLRMAA